MKQIEACMKDHHLWNKSRVEWQASVYERNQGLSERPQSMKEIKGYVKYHYNYSLSSMPILTFSYQFLQCLLPQIRKSYYYTFFFLLEKKMCTMSISSSPCSTFSFCSETLKEILLSILQNEGEVNKLYEWITHTCNSKSLFRDKRTA